jgi:hypothetical protein
MHATRALRNSYSLALKIHCTRGFLGSSLTARINIDTIFGQNRKTFIEKSKRTPTRSVKSSIQPGRRHPEVVDGVWLVVWNGWIDLDSETGTEEGRNTRRWHYPRIRRRKSSPCQSHETSTGRDVDRASERRDISLVRRSSM